ncbi:MAG TPA: hypothetical protein VGL75_16090 [Acidothermaceae bacterium]|jgi:hypothetical protein
MPNAEFGSRRRERGFVAASAVSVVAVVAVVTLVHPWRDTAASNALTNASAPVALSDSPLMSPANSLPAASVSDPAFSSAPDSSPIAISSPAPRTTPLVVRASPTAARVTSDSQLNFKVSVEVSPTQLVFGHPVRVTVTIVNEGGVFNRWAQMFVQGSDPSDNVSDPPPTCTANGGIVCPITGVRPGRTWTFDFTFIPGTFPAMDHFDGPLCAAFNYIDSHGQQQETPEYCAHVMLFNPPGWPPPASGAPSNAPSPSLPPASAAPTSASAAPQSTS